MSKVPDFGWRFDQENHGNHIVISENGRIAKNKTKCRDMHDCMAVINFRLNDDLIDDKVWKININGGISVRATGFGVMESELIDHSDTKTHYKYFGYTTHIKKSTKKMKDWSDGGFNLSYLDTGEGVDIYLKYNVIKKQLSCYSPLLKQEEKMDLSSKLANGESLNPIVLIWGVTKVTLFSAGIKYPLDKEEEEEEEEEEDNINNNNLD
eukprot:TRINITY_DN550_c1_g1_i1.p1 TRINITY_DN550_c1_g1~~TRINITY_DN550_c1_g1_i1.p1  ORF type:complete len:209 (-),score=64.83 TRINITY_DN550_c1_g1_i1:242-868(-)